MSALPMEPVGHNRGFLGPVLRQILSYGLLLLLALTFIYPFALAVTTSFKTLPEINAAPVQLIPDTWTTSGYDVVFRQNVGRWAFNSFFVAVIITVANVVFSGMAGYALSRIRFPGSNLVFLAILGTMMIPGIVQIIPMFIILKQLNMIDAYTGLIVPKMATAFGVFLMKQFFESVPIEIEEASRIDGANRWQMFSRVALPLARSAIVALIIFSFQGSWNEFMHPLIVINTRQDLYTLPLGLALLRGGLGQNLQWNALLAGSMLTTLPMAIIFFIFQGYFIEGISYGGVKG
ncbi:MAG: carbohydrate ABC transporter permease [Chloroflexota bacterium]|nr:carbohydrate ABC transporter permease [Chloroflexota bacterium]